MSKVVILDHPLIQHKLAIARDINTGSGLFRQLVKEISMLMAYEITRDLSLEEVDIQTPMCKTKAKMLQGQKKSLRLINNQNLIFNKGLIIFYTR